MDKQIVLPLTNRGVSEEVTGGHEERKAKVIISSIS